MMRFTLIYSHNSINQCLELKLVYMEHGTYMLTDPKINSHSNSSETLRNINSIQFLLMTEPSTVCFILRNSLVY